MLLCAVKHHISPQNCCHFSKSCCACKRALIIWASYQPKSINSRPPPFFFFDRYLTFQVIQEKRQPFFRICLTFQEKFCCQIEIHGGGEMLLVWKIRRLTSSQEEAVVLGYVHVQQKPHEPGHIVTWSMARKRHCAELVLGSLLSSRMGFPLIWGQSIICPWVAPFHSLQQALCPALSQVQLKNSRRVFCAAQRASRATAGECPTCPSFCNLQLLDLECCLGWWEEKRWGAGREEGTSYSVLGYLVSKNTAVPPAP